MASRSGIICAELIPVYLEVDKRKAEVYLHYEKNLGLFSLFRSKATSQTAVHGYNSNMQLIDIAEKRPVALCKVLRFLVIPGKNSKGPGKQVSYCIEEKVFEQFKPVLVSTCESSDDDSEGDLGGGLDDDPGLVGYNAWKMEYVTDQFNNTCKLRRLPAVIL